MLDIVVEFSSIIKNNSLAFYKQNCTYEGRPIPGSPFEVIVGPNNEQRPPHTTCSGHDIGTAPGTWVLSDLPEDHASPVTFTSANFTWVPDSCRLPDLTCMIASSSRVKAACLPAGHTAMIYAIGDSVTRVQAQSLANLLQERIEGEGETYTQETQHTIFDIHFQATNDGMIPRMVFIKQSIDRLVVCQRSGSCHPVIHFNSGLHDLDKYCGGLAHQISFRQGVGLDESFDCITSYMTLLQQVIDYVDASGFDGVKVFRTTTAAWLKFGNYHVNWFASDKRDEQVFISNWLSVMSFNELAIPIFERAGWRIIDGFQSTIGRPDHTERTPGGALVHFDREVPDAHNHQLLSIILEEYCPEVLASCSHPSRASLDASQSISRGKGRRGATGTFFSH